MITCGPLTPQTATIAGTDFPVSPKVLVTDPSGYPVAVTIVSATSTQIVVSLVFATCGTYEFIVQGDDDSCPSAPFAVVLDAPAPPPCITLDDALDALAARLEDPARVHWTTAELQRYINEALRTWSAYTQYYRSREDFTSTPFQAFYDLPTVIPTTRAYTVTDVDLVLDIEYMLMEPPTPAAWTGTEQFTLEDIVRAIRQARDQFLRETGSVLTHSVTPAVTPSSAGRISVSSDVLQIRRAAWIMASGSVVPLKREDEWAMTSYALKSWQAPTQNPTQTYPTGYSVAVSPPSVVQLAPPPTDPGSIDLLTINAGADLDPTTGVLLGIPDDWTWVVKWKALGDLLRQEGLAWDPERAQYCISRWKHGVGLASQASVVLAAQIDGQPVKVRSVSDCDSYRRTWQTPASTPLKPNSVLTDGQNVVAIAPVQNQAYTVTLDVVANVPIPAAGSDCLSITESIFEPILDYAQHLALAKEGPGQLSQAMSLYNSFERETQVTTRMDQGNVPNRGAIFQQTSQDPSVFPRTGDVERTGTDENAP